MFTSYHNEKQIKDIKQKSLSHKRLKILKVSVPLRGNNIFKNLVNFCIFFCKCYFFSKKLKPSLVFGTSGRLGTNLLATLIANQKKLRYLRHKRFIFIKSKGYFIKKISFF